MAQALKLEVVTPQKVLFTAEADYVTIPGSNGELGILPGHLPLITEMKEGFLSYKRKKEKQEVKVQSGYAEILKDKITVLAIVED